MLSTYLSFAPVSPVMVGGQFHPAAWAITHTIEAFNNAGMLLLVLLLLVLVLVLVVVLLLAVMVLLSFCFLSLLLLLSS